MLLFSAAVSITRQSLNNDISWLSVQGLDQHVSGEHTVLQAIMIFNLAILYSFRAIFVNELLQN